MLFTIDQSVVERFFIKFKVRKSNGLAAQAFANKAKSDQIERIK